MTNLSQTFQFENSIFDFNNYLNFNGKSNSIAIYHLNLENNIAESEFITGTFFGSKDPDAQNLINSLLSFPNTVYDDELDDDYGVSEEIIRETIDVLEKISFSGIKPKIGLFGDDSISLVWATDDLIAGIRFVGIKTLFCYFEFSDIILKSFKIPIYDTECINKFISYVSSFYNI
jgi:hypothetical protein